MAYKGRHRISRRAKIATGGIVTAIAAAVLVVSTTTGDPVNAKADAVDKSLFVDITTVRPNVKKPQQGRGASRGTFTVNCGKNENGHFNPDNFIAQPGVRNGAQHLHDYVGNLSTNADSNNKSLAKAGTTCKNGDKSAYFWPVLRIDTADEEESTSQAPAENSQAGDAQQEQDTRDAESPRVECPDVASNLPEEVPDQAEGQVETELGTMDAQVEDANAKLATAQNPQADVLAPLAEQRKTSLDKVASAIDTTAERPAGLENLAACVVKEENSEGIDNGGQNSDRGNNDPADQQAQNPGPDANNELPGNDGEIQRPETVELTYRGSPVGKVRAMPRFLRVLYGDAKVTTNGPANARDSWTCTGFEDRVLINKYPICPAGSKVKRIHDFPSCWDGKNIDSQNHRTHIVFPNSDGRCKRGFVAVPQLRVSLTYNVPREIQLAGQYKVDSFPEESHNPFSDHDDFANVMSQQIMNRLVNCVNKNRVCNE